MAKVHPVVRYLVPCEEMETQGKQVSLLRLVLNIRSTGTPAYPLLYRQLCVFVVVSDARGPASISVRIVEADSGDEVISSRKQDVGFGSDPLLVYGLRFRLRNCLFPQPGLYWIQFWCDDLVLAQQDLFLR